MIIIIIIMRGGNHNQRYCVFCFDVMECICKCRPQFFLFMFPTAMTHKSDLQNFGAPFLSMVLLDLECDLNFVTFKYSLSYPIRFLMRRMVDFFADDKVMDRWFFISFVFDYACTVSSRLLHCVRCFYILQW